MKKMRARLILLLVVLSLATPLVFGQVKKSFPPQGHPPKPLTKQADGHWSANQVPAKSEGYEVYTVKQGDTLSGIAQQQFKDLHLWPQIWEINPQIVNPHWIYPNDKILLKQVTVLTPPAETAPAPSAPEKPPVVETRAPIPQPTIAPIQPATPPPPAIKKIPVATSTEMYCAGFFASAQIKPTTVLMGGEESEIRSLYGDRDVVYLNKGKDGGLKSGDELMVVRPVRNFSGYGDEFKQAQSTGKYGFYYQDIGRIRLLVVNEHSSIAEVVFACEEMHLGDITIPDEKRVSPTTPLPARLDTLALPNGKTAGQIIMTKEFRTMVGKGNIVYIDAGQKKNVAVGDIFRIYRRFSSGSVDYLNRGQFNASQRSFQEVRKIVGELVVLRVEAGASTAIITSSNQDISVGDEIEQE